MRTVWIAIAGATVGAGVAVLLSPAGKKTRTRAMGAIERCTLETQDFLVKQGRRLRSRATDLERTAEHLYEQGIGLAESGMSAFKTVQELASEGREVLDHGKEVLAKAKSAASAAS